MERFVEGALDLSIHDLIRAAEIAFGSEGQGVMEWPTPEGHSASQRVGFRISMADRVQACVILYFKAAGQPYIRKIDLACTPCHFGGVRWWLVCPVTGRRARKLYYSQACAAFISRQARGMRYRSTCETGLHAARSRLRRLNARLGDPGSEDGEEPVLGRPKGMHEATYRRISGAAAEAAVRLAEARCAALERALRSVRISHSRRHTVACRDAPEIVVPAC